MSTPPTNSDMSYQRLNQKIQDALKEGKNIGKERCERWLDLFVLHNNETDLRNTPFVAMYRTVAKPGIVNRWDENLIRAYQEQVGRQFLAGCALTTVSDLRINDGAWRRSLWDNDEMRGRILRTNMTQKDSFEHTMALWLKRVHHTTVNPKDSLRSFGPWRLASQWFEDVRQGLYANHQDLLTNTAWLYFKHNCQERNEDWLHTYPQSLGGALQFYVYTHCDGMYNDKMVPIFKMPAPDKESVMFFMALSFFKESHDANPTIDSAWTKARQAWPGPCQLLDVFVGMYPTRHAARENILSLTQAFEGQHNDNALTLPEMETSVG